MPYEYTRVEQRGRVGVVTFNKPERLNVFSDAMFGEAPEGIETSFKEAVSAFLEKREPRFHRV